MNVYECVRSLSSVRSYIDREVPGDEIIMEVMESGQVLAECAQQPAMGICAHKNRAMLREMGKYCTSGSFIVQVAFAVVLLVDPRSKWHQIDGTRAAQNMVLTAWSHGLGVLLDRKDREGGA